MAVYPGPFDLHTREAITANTVKDVVPQIIKALTTPLGAASTTKSQKKESPGKEIVFTGTLEEVNRYFTDAGWSDGMAIVPPTTDRIERFHKYTDYAPDQEIATLA